nr:hypothetical protein [Tanacetum cinerariifolium]
MSDPAHVPNVEELIPSPVLELVVQPAQQHHDQATGGSLIYEHPPIPNPATLPVSRTEGTAEVPFTTDQMLALFPMCLQKIDALENDLKATKRLNRDTERKKRLTDLSKSDSEYAKQVALTMETSHAAPAPQVPATGPLPSIERQRDLDDMIANFSNTEWMILMARVKEFPEVAKEILERSTTSQGVKRSGPTLEPGSPKKTKSTAGPSLGSTPADEVPADTGVSTAASVPADQRVSADKSVPADTRIPAGPCVSAEDATTTIP